MGENGKLPIPVDLIRTIAILGVILLHASNDLTTQSMGLISQQAMTLEIFRWTTVDVYQSIGRIGVPLFVMLTGALLLQPSKNESIGVFLKKRWRRIGLPFIFWASAYFAWDFLVEHQAFTSSAVIQGILSGPFFQFWYIYMIVGLYLLTPFLRIMVAHADPSLFKYFIIIWFTGSAILPVFNLLTHFYLDSNVLTIPGFVGYYVLGVYLLNVQIRRSILALFMSVGIALTAIATYFMARSIGGPQTFFFQEYLSPTLILASVTFFLLLTSIKTTPNVKLTNPPATNLNAPNEEKSSPSKVSKLLKLISQNTLPLFLFHEMILLSLQRGYFGFTINGDTINSIIGVPLITVITFAICLAVIVPLKKVPVLKELLG